MNRSPPSVWTTGATLTHPVVTTIRPPGRWRLPDLAEIWFFRELMWVLGVRDIKLRYRQTLIGATWIVVGPLLSAGVFSFVFGNVAKLESDGIPYFAFSYCGLLAWNVFDSTLSRTTSSLVGNAALISKVYFPRLILPISTIFGTTVNFATASGVMVVVLVAYGLGVSFHILLVPLLLALFFMLALGVGLVLAAGTVSYRDVGFIGPLATSLLIYISPVGYSSTAVPARLQTVYHLNPLAGLIDTWRWAILGTAAPKLWWVLWAVGTTLLILIVGSLLFTRMEPRFPDVI